jgi:hypothetical protein
MLSHSSRVIKVCRSRLRLFLSPPMVVVKAQLTMITITVKRASVAILTGSEYQKLLRDCLTEVRNCCDALKEQAGMSLAHRVTSGESGCYKLLSDFVTATSTPCVTNVCTR